MSQTASMIEKKYGQLKEQHGGSWPSVRAEYMLSEMLKMAVFLDSFDYQGCKKMRQIISTMLADRQLPEFLLAPCLDLLQNVSDTNKQFVTASAKAVEILQYGVRDAQFHGIGSEDGTQSASPEECRWGNVCCKSTKRLDGLDLRCIHIVRSLFERVVEQTTFDECPLLDKLYQWIIRPFVDASEQVLTGELGSVDRELHEKIYEESCLCLAFCARASEKCDLASLFKTKFSARLDGGESRQGPKLILLKAKFDLVKEYGSTLIPHDSDEKYKDLLQDCLKDIECHCADPEALEVVCIGLEKLLCLKTVVDSEILVNLYMVYIDPYTRTFQNVRNQLHWFLTGFMQYNHETPQMTVEVFVRIFKWAVHKRKSLDSSEEIFESSKSLCDAFLAYLTPESERKRRSASDSEQESPLDQAKAVGRVELIEAVLSSSCLLDAWLPSLVEGIKLLRIKLLIDKLHLYRTLKAHQAKSKLAKFEETFQKQYKQDLKLMESRDYETFAELNDLFLFLDSIIPDEGSEDDGPPMRGRKRELPSAHNDGGESVSFESDDDCATYSPKEANANDSSPSRIPDPDEVIVISSDPEEEQAIDSPPTESLALNAKSSIAAREEEEEEDAIDEELSRLLSPVNPRAEYTLDSIMDSDVGDLD
ncbi:hypothetical protein BKA70DRAFT_1493489 [Coprinopsis sp. MPI-PUGE-AT-0042]|nr:hypothetical protein BKA70DRAFT_1493489 [Coprinopsis sp. MPI-PUGE-AT-0042]